MSGAFKNAKKKVVQSEFRRLINEQKEKSLKAVKKIESPLAKYNESGQLTCVLCKTIVKSEAVWNVHINAKLHRENVATAKKLKERTNNFTQPMKRPLTPPMQIPAKRPKSILKNSKSNSQEATPSQSNIPADFFDSTAKKPANAIQTVTRAEDKMDTAAPPQAEILPEGFFDDPKQDAKARNQEYKDPVEEEWEQFQKEIREADNRSAAIIAGDQEEATNDRQIDEIDEQMKIFSKVLDFEKMKGTIISVTNESVNAAMDEGSSDEDEDLDEFLDWRSKKAFN